MAMITSFSERWVKVVFSVLFIGIGIAVSAQMLSSDQILREFENLGIDILQPIEGKYKIKVGDMNNELFPHQIAIIENGYKVLIQLKSVDEMQTNLPHIHYSNLMHTLATNETQDDEHIFIYKLPSIEGIDWQSEARFMPKNQISSLDFGILKSYFVADKFFLSVLIIDDNLETRYKQHISFNWLYKKKDKLR